MSDNHTLAEHMPALPFCVLIHYVPIIRQQNAIWSIGMECKIQANIRLPKTLTDEFQLCLKQTREHVLHEHFTIGEVVSLAVEIY